MPARSAMKQIALKYFTDTHLTVIAFVIFFIAFLFLLLLFLIGKSKNYRIGTFFRILNTIST